MEDFEKEKASLFQLFETFRPSDIKLALLIANNNPELKAAAMDRYGTWLDAKGYKRLEGVRSMAIIKDMPFWDDYNLESDWPAHYKDRLSWLHIKHNNLDLFPKAVLAQIENLKITSTVITTLPTHIELMINLKELHLSNCLQLATLPPEIAKLPHLEMITLRRTQFSNKTGIHNFSTQKEIQDYFNKT